MIKGLGPKPFPFGARPRNRVVAAGGLWSLRGAPGAAGVVSACGDRGAAGGYLEEDCFGRHWQNLLKALYSS